MKLSIIIPVYNVERYVGACLDSVYEQQVDEASFEVVVVNDGTPDDSMRVVARYAECHANIVVINKKNGGVSEARNYGIEAARGEYLMFVDADDALLPGSLKQVLEHIDSNEGIELYVARSFNEKGEVYSWKEKLPEGGMLSGVESFRRGYFRGSSCGALYERAFLKRNSLLFPVGVRNGEDTIFFTCCQVLAQRMRYVDIALYKINERAGSASRTQNKETILLYELALRKVKEFECNHTSLSKEQKYLVDFLKYTLISNLTYQAVISRLSYGELQHSLSIRSYLPLEFDKSTLCHNKIGLMNFSYSSFYFIMYFRYKILDFKIKCFKHF